MPRINFPFVCGLDWLQIYVYLHEDLTNVENESFKCIVEDYPTAQFLRRCSVKLKILGGFQPFCYILFAPRTSVLPACAGQMKIENRSLYESDLMPRLSFVMSNLNIEYRSLSRVDVYYDCNKFLGGRLPSKFIQDYTAQKILKIGINRGYLNFANYGYQVANGSRKMPAGFAVGAPAWTGVTWGSKDYVQAQIYNKSEELRQVKYKPHIVQAWESAGLDPKNVWRAEIRITKQGKGLHLLESDDLFSLGAYEIANTHRIHELFQVYADRYFRFVFRDYHVKRQQMRSCKLFCKLTDKEIVIKPKIITQKTHSNRTTKLVNNFLMKLNSYLSENVVTPVGNNMDKQVENVIAQIRATFPDYLFNERKKGEIDVFRRLNQTLLNRRNLLGRPIDVFTSAFLNGNCGECSDIP